MYKLLLLDIDGTLRDEVQGIPASAKEAIKQCVIKGCNVVICTGRSIGTIQDDVLALPIQGYIAGGGSYIKYQSEILCDTFFDQEIMQKVVSILKESKVAFTIESQNKVFMNQKACVLLEDMNQAKGRKSNVNKQFIQEKIIYEDNIALFDHQPIHKICLWADASFYQRVIKPVSEQFDVVQEEPYQDLHYVELIQKGFHKGDAIRTLQEVLAIRKEETICFGDGQNDIGMFQESAVAIAMKQSHTKLKQGATAICESVMEDGIYKELKRRNVI